MHLSSYSVRKPRTYNFRNTVELLRAPSNIHFAMITRMLVRKATTLVFLRDTVQLAKRHASFKPVCGLHEAPLLGSKMMRRGKE
jgi:hypothetical protein